MEPDIDNLIKHREIQFCALRPDPQAHDAGLLLSDIDGVQQVQPLSANLLHVHYDVTRITLQVIDQALTELGFHLSSNLLAKLKRALYYYTEETQRANLGLDKGCDTCIQVFVNRYEKLRHGCRDDRPAHWRGYL